MSQKHIAVIDYGMGNLHSVASALSHVSPDSKIDVTADKRIIENADHVVFPGVGAIRDCMSEIKRLEVDQVVQNAKDSGKPILAICVGMQSLMQRSEENDGVDCLGMFPGTVKFFGANEAFNLCTDEGSSSGERLKVPHMGWNQVQQSKDHPLWHDIADKTRFYFVHSYYVELQNKQIETGETHYGINFTSVVSQDNVFAVQFHPEKSHDAGLQLLRNFVHWDGR